MSTSFWNSPVMNLVLEPRFLILFAVVAFLFFLTMGKMSKGSK
jgi:hypothetical protein